MQAARRLVSNILSPPPTVAVIKLQGMITARAAQSRSPFGISLDKVTKWVDKAFRKQRNLQAVALAINSPGGSPVQSELVASYIRQKAEETKLPVWAFAEDVAASGGYWLMCAGDAGKLYACNTSVVGSVGVISQSFGFVDVLKKTGIESRRSTAGKMKGMMDPFQPVKAEEQERFNSLLTSLHECFKDVVMANRGARLKADPEEVFTGEAFTGPQALKLGLIDGLGTMHRTLKDAYGPMVRLRVVNPTRSAGFLAGSPFSSSVGAAEVSDWTRRAVVDADSAREVIRAVIEEANEAEAYSRYGVGL